MTLQGSLKKTFDQHWSSLASNPMQELSVISKSAYASLTLPALIGKLNSSVKPTTFGDRPNYFQNFFIIL